MRHINNMHLTHSDLQCQKKWNRQRLLLQKLHRKLSNCRTMQKTNQMRNNLSDRTTRF